MDARTEYSTPCVTVMTSAIVPGLTTTVALITLRSASVFQLLRRPPNI
ncbi:hypothetical protein O3G_MSEX014286 [Manduca sexta]|uniref:Uncharacterized protein n=1 Tax=Manduca sexta TaxID=7130 RepID=A0A922CZF4_MANSE|nr:hypothetical protein O3G_MSEX014286 [Manduca sexta]KAG6464123.1 hypothetical protein O3G_MSEX014286 [Manduca sexta]